MPIWLIRLLPYGAAALALGLAVWFIDSRGYERAKAQDIAIEQKLELQRQKLDAEFAKQVTQSEGRMQAGMNSLNQQLGDRIDSIETVNKTIIQPTLMKEIANDPRLSDPANALPVGLWKSINQARAFSSGSCSPGTSPAGCQRMSAGQPSP